MSKLSPSLKALVNAPFARPGPNPASSTIKEVYESIAKDAASRHIGLRPWLTISAAATFTLNSPESLSILHHVANTSTTSASSSAESHANLDPETFNAALIREVGLKCISFNGIPRSINCLNAFHASLPTRVQSRLATQQASRMPTADNIMQSKRRGQKLWNSIYRPFEGKLYDKLGTAHPDLPVVILNHHYGPALADPPSPSAGEPRGSGADGQLKEEGMPHVRLGRFGTSLVAISCLRAQTGVGPQVLSHVFGLRKGVEDGTYKEDVPAVEDETAKWLASDEGGEWILSKVDEIVKALGTNFAQGPSRL